MIKRLLFISTVCFSLTAQAYDIDHLVGDTIIGMDNEKSEQWLRPLEPTYLRDVTLSSGLGDNWFVAVGGGMSAFAGSPLGCEDLFGRIKPATTLQFGKWFTPSVGARVSFQGFDFKNSELQTTGYKLAHADLMFDVANYFNKARDQPRWGVVPYLGLGLIHNEDIGNSPFCFSYGVMGQYSLTHRLHLTLELGGTTTFKDFDGRGDSRQIGDNMMSLTAGLSVTLGKNSMNRSVVDASPFIRQNELLMNYSQSLSEKNRLLVAQHKNDSRAIAEMRKILQIEGLLDYYASKLEVVSMDGNDKGIPRTYPKNDYNGLNSLMARIGEGKWNDTGGDSIPAKRWHKHFGREVAADSVHGSTKLSNQRKWNDYLAAMSENKSCIGTPIYFFFKLDSNNLTDNSQLINLTEIVSIVRKYNLHIRITGAADSATGTEARNEELSKSRAKCIYKQLKSKGISAKCITIVSAGGISEFLPKEGNRFTKVELFFKP